MSTTEPFAMLGDPHASEHEGPTIAAEEYDALTELFLGEGERPAGAVQRSAEDAPEPSPGVNLLVMGHLPVQSSPWASQHARRLATQIGGSVAMLRLRSGHAALDLYGALAGEAPSEFDDLGDAIDWAAARAARWMLRVDDLEEITLANDELVSAVTLLTGSNDMAVVNAYRVIKALDAASSPGTELRVAMMGGEPEASESAMRRLGEAARSFLRREVVFFEPVERIEPVPFAAVFSGRCGLSPGDVARRVSEATTEAAMTPSESTGAHDADRGVKPEAVELDVAPIASRDESLERVEPKLRSRPRGGTPVSTGSAGSLCGYVAGLQRLGIRCRPDQRVELAVGVDGRLHVLGDESVVGLRSIRQAAAWAMQHAELIALAAPQAGGEVRIRQDVEPELHVFTAEPKRVLGSADPMWRVHLLAPVNGAWYHTELV
ncbi:MAG: hypothetical protein AAGI30_01420 [Planctomycetota bacterium]